jgi:hypothetical protein
MSTSVISGGTRLMARKCLKVGILPESKWSPTLRRMGITLCGVLTVIRNLRGLGFMSTATVASSMFKPLPMVARLTTCCHCLRNESQRLVFEDSDAHRASESFLVRFKFSAWMIRLACLSCLVALIRLADVVQLMCQGPERPSDNARQMKSELLHFNATDIPTQ